MEFPCPSCGIPQRAPDHLSGRILRCQKCSKSFIVPLATKQSLDPMDEGKGPDSGDTSDSIFDE